MLSYPPSPRHRPLDALFIHAPMTLFFVVLWTADWIHNGFVALNWLSRTTSTISDPFAKTPQAVLALLLVHGVLAVWIALKSDTWATIGGVWTVLLVLLGNQRKPTIQVVVLVILLVVHPVAYIGGLAWRKIKEREGRIRLEEEAEAGMQGFHEGDQ